MKALTATIAMLLACFSCFAPSASADAENISYAEERIVGGQVAFYGDWDYIAFLLVDTYEGTFTCGASQISPRWFLTAAHCVENDQGDTYSIDSFGLFQGSNDLYDLDRMDLHLTNRVYSHPGFSLDTYRNDLALLRISKGSDFPRIRIANPQSEASSYQAGQKAWVAGWGATSYEGDISFDLLEAEIDIRNNSVCESPSSYGDYFFPAEMICAASPGKDSCQGDSGGPLETRIASQKRLIGVVSFGVGCANPQYPGVYTRLSNYYNWIARHIVDRLDTNHYTLGIKKRRSREIALTNRDYMPASVKAATVSGPFRIVRSSCRGTLDPGRSCKVRIKAKKKGKGKLQVRSAIGSQMISLPLFSK